MSLLYMGHQSCCLLLAHPLNGGHVANSGSGNTSTSTSGWSVHACVQRHVLSIYGHSHISLLLCVNSCTLKVSILAQVGHTHAHKDMHTPACAHTHKHTHTHTHTHTPHIYKYDAAKKHTLHILYRHNTYTAHRPDTCMCYTHLCFMKFT